MNKTCHQSEIAITHWLCSECGHFEPYCYESPEDMMAGNRFEHCPGCGRVVEWDYWDSHPFPGETKRDVAVRKLVREIWSLKPQVLDDDGFPADEDCSDLEVSVGVRQLLDDGVAPDEIKRRLAMKYYGVSVDE